MHKLYELKDKLMKELEDYADNGKFSKDDVEAIKYTASAIDHICNIVEGEDGEYSEAMMPMDDGMSYNYGRSYARGRGGNRGGSYARGGRRRGGANQYGSYMGYSRAGESIADQLRDMVDEAPNSHIRMEIEKLADKVERM